MFRKVTSINTYYSTWFVDKQFDMHPYNKHLTLKFCSLA